MSKLKLLLLLAFGLFCTTLRAQQNKDNTYHWFNFQWMGATIDGRAFDKVAITLPVQISGLRGNFIAQFDLGSDISQLYGNTIKNYFSSRDALFKKLDTAHRSTSDDGSAEYPIKGLKVTTGGYTVPEPYLSDNFGDEVPKDSLYTSSQKNVGTIGASFTKNKVLIIDYPNKRMCLLDSVDSYWSAKTTFVDCRMGKGRIQLPVTINGQVNWIMFDTGASLFPLSIDSTLWKKIVDPHARLDTLHISSWGQIVPCYGAPIISDVYLGTMKMPPAEAWYNQNKRLLEFNRQEGIAGLTGNAYFLHNIIVIDFKNKRFGVVRD